MQFVARSKGNCPGSPPLSAGAPVAPVGDFAAVNLSHNRERAAEMLSLDGKTVVYYLKDVMRRSRRGTKCLPQQGGDVHSIERADLRQFVIDNLALIDFRKVDKFELVDLLVSTEGSAP